MTVVIGGCGDVGTEAGLRYVAAGHSVLGLRRSPEVLPDSFGRQAIDLSAEVPRLPPDTEIVVMATSADGRSEEAYRLAYVQSAANILTAIRRDCLQPPRVLLISSTAVFAVDNGGPVTEDTPASPTTPTAAMLLEAELVLAPADPIVLRLGGIYGPGRGRLIEQARSGGMASPGSHFTNRIHRDDAAAAIVHLTTLAGQPAPLYLGVDDEPADRAEVLQFLAAELGVDRTSAPGGTPQQRTGKQCDNSRLRASGFRFAYPTYREGYRAVLAGLGVRHP